MSITDPSTIAHLLYFDGVVCLFGASYLASTHDKEFSLTARILTAVTWPALPLVFLAYLANQWMRPDKKSSKEELK